MTCSVIVCSTWMRGLHSMKKCSPGFGIDQELDGAGILVARGAGELDRVGQDALAQARVEVGRGRDLDDLLVAQLHRAVALEEMHDVALAVAQHLDLDVARPRHDLLEEQRADRRTRPRPRSGSARRPRPSRRASSRRACRARRRRPRPSASPGSRWTWPAPSPRRSTPAPPARRARPECPAPGRRRGPRPCRRTASALPERAR